MYTGIDTGCPTRILPENILLQVLLIVYCLYPFST